MSFIRNMIKKERKTVLRLLLLAAAAGMLFMGMTEYKMKKENKKGKMLAYMQQKYGENFDFVESYAGQAGKEYTMILAASRSHPKRRALVRLSERGGRRYFEDNYLSYLLKEELEVKIGSLAKECFGECKVYYKIPGFVFPAWFKADMKADEFLKNIYAMPQFYIYPVNSSGSREEWEEKIQKFRCLNADLHYKIRGTVSLAKTKEDFELVTADNFAESDYLGYEALAELIFSMDEKGNFRYLRWLKKVVPEGR